MSRLMQATKCFLPGYDGICLHTKEHVEVLAEDHPEPYYQETCAYHKCKPVEVKNETSTINAPVGLPTE